MGREHSWWVWSFPSQEEHGNSMELGCAGSLTDFPFPLQAFPAGEGADFHSAQCSEGDLPGAVQRLHGAAPAAPEPAGSGDRAQGTDCSLLGPVATWTQAAPQGVKSFSLAVCLMATGHCQLSYLHVVALPSLPSVHYPKLGWSLEAKQEEPFACCLPGHGSLSSATHPVHQGQLVHAWWAMCREKGSP